MQLYSVRKFVNMSGDVFVRVVQKLLGPAATSFVDVMARMSSWGLTRVLLINSRFQGCSSLPTTTYIHKTPVLKMASLPHIIDDKTLPETPAHEWANDTTSALGASTTSTPGQDFPGAYPSGHELSPSESKNTTLGILDTAKSYIPAQKDVENAFLSASGTAKHYLPESVASYLRGYPILFHRFVTAN